jgi:transposase
MLTKEEEMESETTCNGNDTTEKRRLYMALELSQKEWKAGFGVGPGQAPRLRSVVGRDGIWLHRYLEAEGMKILVVDSASIEVSRRF